MKNQITNLLRFLPKRDAGLMCSVQRETIQPIGATPGESRGSGDVMHQQPLLSPYNRKGLGQPSPIVRVWRFVAVGALTAPLVVGALSDVAFAGTTDLSPPVGSYTAPSPQYSGDPITFYVSSNQKALQDIAIPAVDLGCKGGGATNNLPFGITTVALKADGSFSGKTHQDGAFGNLRAKFTYTFEGNFQGLNSSGVATIGGTFLETMAYTASSKRVTCTSNNQSWTATWDTQPAQTTSAPPVGSYTAPSPQYSGDPITFYVSSNQKALQDIAIPTVDLGCEGGGITNNLPFGIATIALKANGSFSGTVHQDGVFGNVPATFTYTFAGNFHSMNASGVERAAGMFRETMVYTASTGPVSCTSNNQSWTATWDTQPAQTASAPPAGSYTAPSPQYSGDPITFDVSSNQQALQDISITTVDLGCEGGAVTNNLPFGIASVALQANGSFSGTTSQDGVYGGDPATFTYTFAGNFHSVNASDVERAAGMFNETMVYTASSGPVTCTSNNQSWTATQTSS